MKITKISKLSGLLITVAVFLAVPLTASALDTVPGSTDNQQHLMNIQAKGDSEIARRLKTLNTLDSKVNSAVKLTAGDKSSLTSQVNSEISGLTALKTKLDGETTLAGAVTDAKSIISDYRVYALIVPKVMLIKTADDQQAVQAKLTDLSGKLKTRLDSASGKDVSSLQTSLNDLNSQVAAASAISSSVETKVLPLQPTDYDSDHTLLTGYRQQLQTAHSDDQAAINDAKTIISGLKS